MRLTTLVCAGLLALSMTATQAHAEFGTNADRGYGKASNNSDGNGNGGFMQGLRDLLNFGAGKAVGGGSGGGKGTDRTDRNGNRGGAFD